MGVDFFWRRAEPALLGDDLSDLVPYWFDERFDQLREAGIIVGVEDTGELITALLQLADLPGDLIPDDLDTDEPGVLDPDDVATMASVLAGIEPAALVRQYRDELAEITGEMGYHRPFNDQWAKSLADDMGELTTLFASAAAAGEAVIVTVVA